MAPRILGIIRKEFNDSIRNRWLIVFTIISFFLVIGLPFIVAFSMGVMAPGMQTLINGTTQVVYPFLPLIALPIGSAAIVGERDRHTLELLLSQPISRITVFIGKFVGIFFAIAVAITLGMGVSALIIMETPSPQYIWVLVLAFFLTIGMLGLAFLISTLSRERSMALGIALFFWFAFAVLFDLSFLSVLLTMTLQAEWIVPIVTINPLEVTKLLAWFTLSVNPEAINPLTAGPTGMALIKVFGKEGFLPFLYTTLACWILIPTVSSFIIFIKKDI